MQFYSLIISLAVALRLAPTSPTCDTWNPLHGNKGLHCFDLLARPDFPDAAGRARLIPAASPFGLAVTRDGIPIWNLELTLAGLGRGTHVAWAASPMLDSVVRLGTVRNGTARYGPVALEQFTVFVTKETLAGAREMGEIVLRGMSPSSIVQPHGSSVLPSRGPAQHRHAPGWEMPPMHPLVPLMPPGLEVVSPNVAPWRAGEGLRLDSLPPLGARTIVRLADGDTLRLAAGLVRRTVAGRSFVAYAFNGQSPGPLLQVARGARVTVELENRLDQPTTVHWHGIRLEQRFDGVPGLSQSPVAPGARFSYQLVFPDAGIYWYHPHVREDIQQELGLYGNILVRGADSARMGRVHREEVLILDDLLLGSDGPSAFGREHATHALMGRFGNVFLVNGEPSAALDARPGEVVRFYLTNAANARTFNVSIDGARMKLVGGDMGRVRNERWVESVVIGPAERWIVDVHFARAGKYPILNRVRGIHPIDRAFIPVVDTLGSVTVSGRRVTPDLARSHAALRRHTDQGAPPVPPVSPVLPVRALSLTLRPGGLPFGLVQALRVDTAWAMPVEWAGLMPMMDWLATGADVTWVLRDSATGRENMDIDWRFRRGERILLRLVSDRHTLHPMQHPIHLHGQRFLVVARNGEPVRDHVWKDTVLVPAGATVDLLVEFDNPGKWMLHCHTAEHLESGMHLVITVD